MIFTLSRPLALAFALSTLALTSSAALASSHPVGPYTKAQTYAICDAANGLRTAAPAQWGCEAERFALACTMAGKLCVIDLFGRPADGSFRAQPVTVAATGGADGAVGGNPNGGGFNGLGVGKIDTSGLKMDMGNDTRGGGTIVVNGGHHGNGGPLH